MPPRRARLKTRFLPERSRGAPQRLVSFASNSETFKLAVMSDLSTYIYIPNRIYIMYRYIYIPTGIYICTTDILVESLDV